MPQASPILIAAAIETHRQEIEHYLEVRLGCTETARDLFQSIIENLLRRSSPTGLSNLRAYLYQAARNALKNHHRDAAVRARVLSNAGFSEESPALEQVVESEQNLARLNAAIAELPVLTRQILIMHRVQGISQRVIADHFNIHVSTVEKRLKQALTYCLHKSAR
ncbi:MAG: RNA polymerase sigma factor [Pseudomonadota bacterium]